MVSPSGKRRGQLSNLCFRSHLLHKGKGRDNACAAVTRTFLRVMHAHFMDCSRYINRYIDKCPSIVAKEFNLTVHPKCSLSKAAHLGYIIYVVPPQSWGDRSDTKHSKCLLLGGRRLNQLTLIPKPKESGGARAATAQVGPANKRNDTKRCLPVEASLRPGEAVPW